MLSLRLVSAPALRRPALLRALQSARRVPASCRSTTSPGGSSRTCATTSAACCVWLHAIRRRHMGCIGCSNTGTPWPSDWGTRARTRLPCPRSRTPRAKGRAGACTRDSAAELGRAVCARHHHICTATSHVRRPSPCQVHAWLRRFHPSPAAVPHPLPFPPELRHDFLTTLRDPPVVHSHRPPLIPHFPPLSPTFWRGSGNAAV